MRTHVALLKGINVGGKNLLKMADLRQMFADLGMESVETLLQSGNVVFGCSGMSLVELGALFEKEASTRLGINVRFFVRTLDQMDEIVRDNPFTAEALADPSHLLVHFMGAVPLQFDIERVQAAVSGPEKIQAGHCHLYVVYPDGIGTSTIARTPGWNRLTADGTARNWNTVLKLVSLLHT